MNRNMLIGLVVVVLLIAGGVYYTGAQNGPSDGTPANGETAGSSQIDLTAGDIPASADDYKMIVAYGDPSAPIKIIEFASMTCPHCAEFHTKDLPALQADYIDTGKVYLELHPFPLDILAARATMLASCGGDKNAAFTSVLFAQQRSWATAADPAEALAKIAKLGGMSREAFDKCMADEALFQAIAKSRYDAQASYKISGTPSFLINGKLISEPFHKSTFKDLLD